MTLHEGLAIGHARANDAAKSAGSEWVQTALMAFTEFAKKNRTFTTEQVRAAYPDMEEPPDMRAWGAIPRLARKEGIVEPHGWVRADSRSVHGMVVTLWQSKVFRGDHL